MQFGVLGPLQVVTGSSGGPSVISAVRLRALLAALLWQANQPVPIDELAELVWDGAPPGKPTVAMRSLVMRLRRQLGPQAAERIITRAPGYVIEVSAGELDAVRFEALAKEAGAAIRGQRWPQAARACRGALVLWRGTPLADVPSQRLRDQWVPQLEQLCVQTLEWRVEADLCNGDHEHLVHELQELTGRYPLRERFRHQLMLALYRCGRQAEALAAYQDTRQVLIDELGVEPARDLQELHQLMLNADPALIAAKPTAAKPAMLEQAELTGPVPRELPPAIPGFTGRSAELDALTGLLPRPGERTPGAVVISAIGGTAGVGKTALAVRWAHQAADRFPDGQLYVSLRGYDPGQPMPAADALASFLRSLGVPGRDIPAEAGQRAARYRSLLADKRMLIVLDNARDADQVRPLLPASQASLVIITSRSQLTGLAAADGARLLSLDVLPHDEAVQLLTARIGTHRAAAEPGAADEIAALCAHLPLALAVAAARAAARPAFPLAALATELRNSTARLDVLDAGDPAASVRAVFSWSYRQLSPEAARLFRLLGLHPGPDISVPAAASLAAADLPETRRLLRELVGTCLINEHAPGRYAFHDLLRAYAADIARNTDSEPERDAAISRTLDHYLHTAAQATVVLHPAHEPLALVAPVAGAVPEQPADHRDALAWFEAEHPVLLAAVTLASEARADIHAWQLPWAMREYLYRQSYLREQITIMGTALAAATRLDDVLGQAVSLRGLARAYAHTGDYDQARTHVGECLPLFQQVGDRISEAWAHQNLSGLDDGQGRYAEGLAHIEQAIRLFHDAGHDAGEAEALGNSAWFHAKLGHYRQARALCEQALASTAQLRGCDFECAILDTLGYIERQLGNFAKATTHFEAALTSCRDYGFRSFEAEILGHAGDTHHAAGDLPQARQAWQQALAIYDGLHHPDADKIRAKLDRNRG